MSAILQPPAFFGATPRAAARTRSRILLRAAAAIYALFALGHTLGAMLSDTHRGPRQAALFAAMQSYTFDVQGMTRSYWDFYRGFGFMVTVLLTFTAALCWVLGDLGTTHPRETRRVLHVLIGAMAATTWFSFVDFFAVPMLFSAIALAGLVVASVALGREATVPTVRGARR